MSPTLRSFNCNLLLFNSFFLILSKFALSLVCSEATFKTSQKSGSRSFSSFCRHSKLKAVIASLLVFLSKLTSTGFFFEPAWQSEFHSRSISLITIFNVSSLILGCRIAALAICLNDPITIIIMIIIMMIIIIITTIIIMIIIIIIAALTGVNQSRRPTFLLIFLARVIRVHFRLV